MGIEQLESINLCSKRTADSETNFATHYIHLRWLRESLYLATRLYKILEKKRRKTTERQVRGA